MSVTQSFADKVAAHIPGADRSAVFAALNKWEPYENASADFNPLATTQHMPGSRPLGGNASQNNGNPVQEYPNEDVGAAATAQTLMAGYYPDLLEWVKTGKASDPSKIAQQLRTWGTTGLAAQFDNGSVTNGRALTADTVSAGGGDSTVGDNSDYDNGTTGYIISTIGQPPRRDDPKYAVDANGQPASALDAESNYLAALKQWGDTAVSLGRSYQLTHPTKSLPNPNALTRDDLLAQQDITNANNAGTLQHYQNQDALTKSQSDINAFYAGQGESRARAETALKGQEDLIKYGTPKAGPQDFSYNDMGGGSVWAKLLGVDPTKSMYHVSGTTYLDPQGDMSANDNLLGVSGKPPSSANLLNGTPPSTGGGAPPTMPFGYNLPGGSTVVQPGQDILKDFTTWAGNRPTTGMTPPYAANLGLEQTVGAKPNAFNSGPLASNNLLTGPAAKVWTGPPHMFQWG